MEEIEFFLADAKESMEKSIVHVSVEFNKIRAGKANPAMLDTILVEYYGSMTPLSQVAAVNTPDPRTIAIKPFEKKLVNEIEKAIRMANLGFNPSNDGELIRIPVPPLTEERRKDLVKQAKNESENGKIGVRNIRKDTNDALRKLLKDGAAEDAIKDAEAKVQKLTDAYIAEIDKILAKKEVEIMTV